MDGYAVRADDVAHVPTDLSVVGEVAAGRPFAGAIKAGEAVRIFTGGELPAGADTIVIQENTTRDGGRHRDRRPHCRRPAATSASSGLDFDEGDAAAAARPRSDRPRSWPRGRR